MSARLPRIQSAKNPLLQAVRAVRAGRDPDRVLLEGERLVGDALAAGVAIDVLLVADERPLPAALEALAERCRRVDGALLAAVSALDSPPGLLALAAAPTLLPFADCRATPDALAVVAAGLQDPGNLGALARVAEAAGATALVHHGGARPFGDKALRGSMGSLLRLPVYALGDPGELAARGWRVAVAATRGGADPRRFDWSGPIALWVSGETGGEPPAGAAPLTLPMAGKVESLNVATAAALLLYAAGRV